MSGLKSIVSQLKTDWTLLAQVAVWVSAPIFLFVLPPPRIGAEAAASSFTHLSQFLIALVTGLVIVFTRHNRNPTGVHALVAIAICLAIVAIAMFFGYWILIGNWTCAYDGRGVSVIGATLLPDARAYMAANPTFGCTRLIQDYAGAVDAIWPRSELVARQAVLGGIFVGMVISFAVAALMVLQAMGRTAARRAGVA